jgi:hypothetical protein
MKTGLRRQSNSIFHGSYKSPRFHRPRILFLVILLFSTIALVSADNDSSSPAATTVYATTDSAENSTITATPLPTGANATDTSDSPTSTNSDPTNTLNVAQNTSPITIPQPFDTAKLTDTGSNFTTTTCPQFMRTFLADPSFRACVPFSLLLYTSVGFTQLTRSVCHSCLNC